MTYEQSKYMNGDENASASFAPKPSETTQPQITNEQDPSIQTTQEPKKGVIDTVKGWFNKGNKETVPQSDTTSYLPETMGDKEQSLYQNVASNDVDSDTKLQEQGQGKKEAIESVVPRYDKKTWKSLMADPNMSWDQKAELVLNGLGGALSAADTGQVQQTDKKQINDAITQQYAENIADRDKRAMNAQIEPLEALNKQQTDVELRLRDTPVSAYIDRYNAEQSAETKKQVLEALIKDKGTWSRLSNQQKMDTLSYIQALDGNGSLLGMALQEFGPDVLNWLKSMTKGNGEEAETSNASTESITIDGVQVNTRPGGEINQNDYNENPDNYMVFPAYGGKSPIVLKKLGMLRFGIDNAGAKADREWVRQYLADNPNLTPEEKIAYAQEYEASMPPAYKFLERQVKLDMENAGEKNPSFQGIEVPVDKMKNSQDDKGLKTRKDNATEVQTEINNIQSQVTNGSMTPSDAIKKIDALAPKMENMEDGAGLIALKAEGLMRDYVMQDIKGYVESDAKNPMKNATASLSSLERMVEQYGDKIAQDPTLREKVDNMYTKYRYQENYIDPFMKSIGQSVYETRNASGVPGDSWKIGSDGQIWDMDPYNLSGKYKPIDFATYQWDKNKNAKANAISALTSVYDKANPETVKKNMGSVPIEGQGEVFRESPIYKFMESLAKDENFKNKAYAVNKSGAFIHPDMKSMYDKINGRYLMWKNK